MRDRTVRLTDKGRLLPLGSDSLKDPIGTLLRKSEMTITQISARNTTHASVSGLAHGNISGHWGLIRFPGVMCT